MTFDDKTLGAYVDDELEPVDRARIEAALVGDTDLAARIDRARRLRDLLGGSFASIITEPASERFVNAIAKPEPASAPLASAQILKFQTPPKSKPEKAVEVPKPWSGPGWGVLAASLAVGVAIGVAAPWRDAPRDAPLSRSRSVTAALDHQASGHNPGPVRIGLSFKSKDGAYCRTFLADSTAGLACREGNGWAVRASAPATSETHTVYRTAASETPAAVLDAVDALIDGAPLDAAAEVSAKARNWR
jgi:hypothetical protein